MRKLMMWRRFILAASLCLIAAAVVTRRSALAQMQNDPTDPSTTGRMLRAGACAIDITPRKFPVIVNGGFNEQQAARANDSLHARCLALDDGTVRMAIAVVDSCLIPRELLDEAKQIAHEAIGIPTERMLISATHTHSAPSVMGALGSDPDRDYSRFLPGQIAKGIEMAVKNLAPARIGWAVAEDREHTHCRRWILRPDKMQSDPFGQRTVRAMMHPGHQNPDYLGPAGPVDPELSMVSIQSPDGRPIALLANYSMHYYGTSAVSADYYGRFADKFKQLIGAEGVEPPFVGIMCQGTSGDQQWMDYSQPAKPRNIDAYAETIARVAFEAYKKIQYHDRALLEMREKKITLGVRLADAQRLAWAKQVVADIGDRKPNTKPEIYAREQVLLSERPTRELKLQAIRIGDLGIVAIPCEVFGITGLKIKAQSPLVPTFTIELANGAEGYIPPPEQHKLGGYTTWAARTAGLEVKAEPKIVDAVLGMLEEVSGRPRRPVVETHGLYAQTVLASKPAAYWRMGEFEGPRAVDATGKNNNGEYEDGVAFYLEGPASPTLSGDERINRAPHFAGGRMKAAIKDLGANYSIEMWFYSALPVDARDVTGYLFSRGVADVQGAPGDHLGIGGKDSATGRLFFFNGNARNQLLSGTTEIHSKTWNHIVLVRNGKKVTVYLNGRTAPEISGEADIGFPSGATQLFIGGRSDNFANLEGRIDEVAVYDRALSAEQVAKHCDIARLRAP